MGHRGIPIPIPCFPTVTLPLLSSHQILLSIHICYISILPLLPCLFNSTRYAHPMAYVVDVCIS